MPGVAGPLSPTGRLSSAYSLPPGEPQGIPTRGTAHPVSDIVTSSPIPEVGRNDQTFRVELRAPRARSERGRFLIGRGGENSRGRMLRAGGFHPPYVRPSTRIQSFVIID